MYYLVENTTGQSKESPCKLIYHCTSPYNFGQDVNYIYLYMFTPIYIYIYIYNMNDNI